ncbi:hypothetical protein ACTHRH_17720 [Paenibacillus sp. SAFN-117]
MTYAVAITYAPSGQTRTAFARTIVYGLSLKRYSGGDRAVFMRNGPGSLGKFLAAKARGILCRHAAMSGINKPNP